MCFKYNIGLLIGYTIKLKVSRFGARFTSLRGSRGGQGERRRRTNASTRRTDSGSRSRPRIRINEHGEPTTQKLSWSESLRLVEVNGKNNKRYRVPIDMVSSTTCSLFKKPIINSLRSFQFFF